MNPIIQQFCTAQNITPLSYWSTITSKNRLLKEAGIIYANASQADKDDFIDDARQHLPKSEYSRVIKEFEKRCHIKRIEEYFANLGFPINGDTVYDDYSKLTNAWFIANEVDVDNSGVTTWGGKYIPDADRTFALNKFQTEVRINLNLDVDYTTLQKLFEIWINARNVQRRREISNRIAYDPNIDASEDWARVGQLFKNPPHLSIAVLQHFIYTVKLKDLNLPQYYIIMPVIYGAIQGTGKTEFCKKFFEPIKELSKSVSVSDVLDNKNHGLAQQLVVFLDEIAKCRKEDAEALKTKLTEEENTSRTMYSQSTTSTRNLNSYIGTSNRPLDQVIYDDTGMRRFFQLNWAPSTAAEAKEKYFPIIESINFAALWHSVDVNTPSKDLPINVHYDEISKYQESFVMRSSAEQFIWDEAITYAPDSKPLFERMKINKFKRNMLWELYQKWCAITNNKPMAQGTLYMQLDNLYAANKLSRSCSGNSYSYGVI